MAQSTALALPDVAKEAGLDLDTWATMTQLYAGNKPESIALVARYCRARKLDPLRKPVHIVPMWVVDKVSNRGSMVDVIMPGIHELRTTAARTMELAGQDEPVFGPSIEVLVGMKATGPDANKLTVPEWCKVTVYRMVRTNDVTGEKTRVAYTAIEFFEENVARTKEGVINAMWQKRSRGQLAKCASAAAIRMGFPEESGGVMTMEEMAGKSINNDAIDGEYSVVTPDATDIPDPISTATQDAAQPQPKPQQVADKPRPAAERPRNPDGPKEQPAPRASADKPPSTGDYERTQTKSQFVVDVTGKPREILLNVAARKGISEADLLAHAGASIDLGNVNNEMTWLRSLPDKE